MLEVVIAPKIVLWDEEHAVIVRVSYIIRVASHLQGLNPSHRRKGSFLSGPLMTEPSESIRDTVGEYTTENLT